jgi:APA family basic amino acid/polyamine antiporter
MPLVSILGILVNGGLMCSLGRDNWIRLFVWLVVGLTIYVGYSRHHSVLTRRIAAGSDQRGSALAVASPLSQD